MAVLCVATWNIRWVLDHWESRWPLLIKHIGSMKDGKEAPDVLAMQEVNIGGSRTGQDYLLGRIFKGHSVIAASGARELLQNGWPMPILNKICTGLAFLPGLGLLMDAAAWFCGRFFERIFGRYTMLIYYTPILRELVYVLTGCAFVIGNATLVSDSYRVFGRETLSLGNEKFALRLVLETKEGTRVSVTNVHTASGRENTELRKNQALKMIEWLNSFRDSDDAQIVLGDFNATPDEPLHPEFKKAGFASAGFEDMGKEPELTFHQRHESPSKDIDPEGCLDYIFFRGKALSLKRKSFRVIGTQPASERESYLYPSDHFALQASFLIAPKWER